MTRFTPGAWIGPYQVVRELGRGGMGAVLEVRHPEIPRPLALKVVLAGELDAGQERRFAREAELLGQLTHPGVVRVHATGSTPEGRPYLVAELVPGTDLERVVRAGIPEPRRAAVIVRDLADALEHVHARGIVHRDLKPANAILTPEGRPVLLDFGLARAEHLERLTRSGALLGTPAYMAPEQVEGSQVGPLADVYGLGAILFFLLTGRAPFAGAGVAILKQVIVNEPTWPAEGIPRDLLAICRQAMAKAPEARYGSAGALRDDLDRFVRGEAVEARPPVVTRSHVRLGVVGAAVLLLLVAAGGAVWGVRRFVAPPEPERPPTVELEKTRTPGQLLEEALGRTGDGLRVELQAWLAAHANHPDAGRAWEALRAVGYDLPLAQLRHAAGSPVRSEQERELRLVRGRFVGPREVVTWCGSELRFWSLPGGLGPAGEARRVVTAPDVRPARPWIVRDACPLPGGDLLLVLGDLERERRARLARFAPGPGTWELFDPELELWPWRMAVAATSDGSVRVALGGRASVEAEAGGLRRGRLALFELAPGRPARLALGELHEAPVGAFQFTPDGDELLFGSGGAAESHEGAIVQSQNRVLRLGWPAPGAAPTRVPGEREWETEQLPNAPTELLRLPEGDLLVGTHGHAIYRFGPRLERRDPDEVPAPMARDLASHGEALVGAIRIAHGGTVRGLALVGERLLSVSGDFGPERGPANNELRWWRLPGFEELEGLRRKGLPEAPAWLQVSPDGRAFLLGFVDRVEVRAVPPD